MCNMSIGKEDRLTGETEREREEKGGGGGEQQLENGGRHTIHVKVVFQLYKNQ